MSTEKLLVTADTTLTKKQLAALPSYIGLVDPVLERKTKTTSADVATAYEGIFMPECLQLRADPDNYSVTLMSCLCSGQPRQVLIVTICSVELQVCYLLQPGQICHRGCWAYC